MTIIVVIPNIQKESFSMGFQKITALSLTDLFVQQIENMILSGELSIGEKLPPARELSVRMEVSRPVISAGIVELGKLGFVDIVPRQGVYVSDYRRKGTVETLVAIMRYNQGTMRKSEVKSLLEVRESLECLCTHLVLENSSNESLEALGTILDDLKSATSAEDAAEKTFCFFHELAILSGNVLLPLMYHSFKAPGVHLWSIYAKKFGIKALYDLKMEYYRALLNRNEEEAIAQVHAIMQKAVENLSFYGA